MGEWVGTGVDFVSGGGVGALKSGGKALIGGIAKRGKSVYAGLAKNFGDDASRALAHETAGNCSIWRRIIKGTRCFEAGTPVHITSTPDPKTGFESLAVHSSLDSRIQGVCFDSLSSSNTNQQPTAQTVARSQQASTLPIEAVPLGATINTVNPDGSGFDAHHETTQDWLRVSVLMNRSDGATIEAELLRRRELAEPLNVGDTYELELDTPGLSGTATVTSIDDDVMLGDGEGNLVVSRFKTVGHHDVVVLHVHGQSPITGTPDHPFWVIDQNQFVPMGELQRGDRVIGIDGPLEVLSVELLQEKRTVYNLEVDGQHVYRVGPAGILVHNADYDGLAKEVAENAPRRIGKDIPFGFSSADDFSQFGARLNAGLPDGAQAVFQGSSVTGKSFRTGAGFDVGRVSDFDIGISSQSLFTRASQLDPRFGLRVKTAPNRIGPLGNDALEELGLKSLRDSLSTGAGGRPVEFLLFDNLNSAFRRPSLFVPQ